MRHTTPSRYASIKALAACWCVWAAALVALAQRVSMAKKQRASSGADTAREARTFLVFALVQISADIAAITAQGRPASRSERHALGFLKAVHSALSVSVSSRIDLIPIRIVSVLTARAKIANTIL